MAKKMSGLGRGLGDLLEDNTPSVRQGGQGSAVRIGSVVPPSSPVVETKAPAPTPKPLYAEVHRNKSLKANFKNFK